MKLTIKNIVFPMLLVGCISSTHAGDVCNILPGLIDCGRGEVEHIKGDGAANINGTTITGKTVFNGAFSAHNATFSSVELKGSVNFIHCTVSDLSSIKGSLVASSTKFNNRLTVYSNKVEFVNSQIAGDLYMPRTEQEEQVVVLDKHSRVKGNIVFDGRHGIVILREKSKVDGKIIGGEARKK
tara:strand:+ start:4940 stop:5488 length:549 start_codon:yes stop_codon:yes gene_type:complete